MAMHMPVSVASFKPDLLNDIRVEHGQPLCNEGQAAHACKDLQRWLDGVGLQQGLVSGGVHTFFTGCHWFVLRTAVHYVTVIHCKESKKRTCCMFMHCSTLYLIETWSSLWEESHHSNEIDSSPWCPCFTSVIWHWRRRLTVKIKHGVKGVTPTSPSSVLTHQHLLCWHGLADLWKDLNKALVSW